MAEDEDQRNKFMQHLMATHEWRFVLRVGQAVDARLPEVSGGSVATAASSKTPRTSTTTTRTGAVPAAAEGGAHSAKWHEARVVQVDGDRVELHFLGFSDRFDTVTDVLSCGIQPLHTFTRPWRQQLKRGSVVEVRVTSENRNEGHVGSGDGADGDDDGGGCWEKGIVIEVDPQAGSAGRDDGHDGEDFGSDQVQQLGEKSFRNSRKVTAVLVVVETGGAKGDRRWIDVSSENICPEGTHLAYNFSGESYKQGGSSLASRQCPPSSPRPPSAPQSSPAVIGDVGDGTARSCDADNSSVFNKRVALVGSSGGGAAAQGQFDGLSLLRLAKTELQRAGVHLAAVQFVACSEPLDVASPNSAATLWVAGGSDRDQDLVVAAEGTLAEVNTAAKREDARIAAALRAGYCGGQHNDRETTTLEEIPIATAEPEAGRLPPLHGLVTISCDVEGVNRQTLTAARDCRAPVVGTGGSSLGAVMAMGCLLVGSSGGSVATTNKSKVVSYVAGLAGHWRLGYDSAKELMQPLAPAATFAGCLPVQIGVMVAVALGSRSTVSSSSSLVEAPWVIRLSGAVPVVAAAVAARQVSTLGDMATAAGIIAGSMCVEDTLAALAAGTLAGYLCSKMTGYALDFGVPATALSLYATASSGILSGAIALFFLPCLKMLGAVMVSTNTLLLGVRCAWIRAVIGAGMGCLMCYGSKIGWYHRFFLPVIVLELAAGSGSIWGSIDLCALCMVAAGLCGAHVVRPRTDTDLSLARRGLAFNLCFGDFVEAAYPFMDRCRRCNAGAYLGSALSGAVVAVGGAASTAYLPLPLAVLACSRPWWLLGAAGAAFLPGFLMGLVSGPREKQKI